MGAANYRIGEHLGCDPTRVVWTAKHAALYGQATMTQIETREAASPSISGGATIRVGIIGAAGIAGGELVRILERHPHVRIVGLQGRDRDHQPLAESQPQLSRTGHYIETALPPVDAVFMALPHGASAALAPDFVEQGIAVIDLGSDYRLKDPSAYERWYDYTHPAPELLAKSVYGLPEQHRAELQALQGTDTILVGSPGCYPTASMMGLYPLARAGLIADVVVDAKSGVSGAGRSVMADLMYSEVNDSIKAYGIHGHRHLSELVQEISDAGPTPDSNPGAATVGFTPHLVPMNRGILATGHVRPTRDIDNTELRQLYDEAYGDEYFVEVVDTAPATSHVRGSNFVRVYVHFAERTGRITTVSVEDNLVKGAAGQAVQAFNIVFDLPESTGLEQLPIVP
jgi:N-acetyl-gamma-glutamyl-phosphate reductase